MIQKVYKILRAYNTGTYMWVYAMFVFFKYRTEK